MSTPQKVRHSKKLMTLTSNDLLFLSLAVRLRAQACEDNLETRDAKTWRELEAKLEGFIQTRST